MANEVALRKLYGMYSQNAKMSLKNVEKLFYEDSKVKISLHDIVYAYGMSQTVCIHED